MKKKGKSKLFIILAIFIILILANLIVFTVKYTSNEKKPLEISKNEVNVTVNKGESLYGIFERLNNEGILKSSFFSKIYANFNGVKGGIQPGEYSFKQDTSLKEFIEILQTGKVISTKITFPEGYTIDDIAKKLDESGLATKVEFLEAVKTYPLPSYVKPNENERYALEGFLFPDTYNFSPKITSNEIIETMLSRFEEVMKEIEKETGKTISEEEYEKYVTIASMIEKEARIDNERSKIASVIYNRLNKDMNLQIDATVLYALGKHKEVVLYKDLKINSPYNTYKIKGLPAGPICNPGKPSLLAAINPEQTEYLFYVYSSIENKHVFSKTYEEHKKISKDLGY
ncbi:endolytic transglycosylase MltG [Clostridium tarantellae]|uniref:Endolytic murein transglycosylase n=1 Tax=Clostridium tarantellae TaxID=39493 RepID=A0A6I1MKX3_9CLOT|nr:endolytic transglycosylase MltG [Clostridium tarantellae]MPQ43098.1 endolytic transglycosylase MltG [Clostridium tarantellae]